MPLLALILATMDVSWLRMGIELNLWRVGPVGRPHHRFCTVFLLQPLS